jgi:hypothetical protein
MKPKLLHQAADLLDELRVRATPTPWTTTAKSAQYGALVGPTQPDTHPSDVEGYGGVLLAESLTPPNLALLTTLGAVVEPLAAWLRTEASQYDDEDDLASDHPACRLARRITTTETNR